MPPLLILTERSDSPSIAVRLRETAWAREAGSLGRDSLLEPSANTALFRYLFILSAFCVHSLFTFERLLSNSFVAFTPAVKARDWISIRHCVTRRADTMGR